MDRPQTHWFYKRIKASAIEHQFYFELGGSLAFLLRRFHMIQPEFKQVTGAGTGLLPWSFKTAALPAAPRVQAFANDGTFLYIGLNNTGGIWRSGDNGATWTNTGGLAQTKQIIVAGSHIVAIGPGGIVESPNQGATWNVIPGAPDLSTASSIAYNGFVLMLGTSTQVYWSSDFLGSWTPAIVPIVGAFITAIIPEKIGDVTNGTFYACSFTGGMQKTTDAGLNWAAINTGLTSADCQCVSLAAGVLYCGTNTTGVYKSINNGALWTAENTGITDLNIASIFNSTALIAIAGTQTNGLFLTIDGGATWTAQNTGLTGFALAGVRVVNIGGYFWAGTEDGLFQTSFNSIIPYPKLGVEFIDGTGAIRWQLQALPAELYSSPRYNGVVVKTETAPYDNTGFGVNLSAVFKPRSNTINLFYDVGELVTCKLTGFEFLTPPGNFCPDYVDIAIEGVYIPNMPNPESVL
jgi:hypothetical protein